MRLPLQLALRVAVLWAAPAPEGAVEGLLADLVMCRAILLGMDVAVEEGRLAKGAAGGKGCGRNAQAPPALYCVGLFLCGDERCAQKVSSMRLNLSSS